MPSECAHYFNGFTCSGVIANDGIADFTLLFLFYSGVHTLEMLVYISFMDGFVSAQK